MHSPSLRFISRRLTFANVIASLALFVALGGASYAAIKLPANSVGTRQIKTRAVSLQKLSSSARSALKGQKGDTGAPGPAGSAGAAGRDGSSGRSALEPLRSGETIHGVAGGDDHVDRADADIGALVTFPIPAPQPVTDENVVVDGGDDDTPDRCTGSPENPTAPPGVVCIYRTTVEINAGGFRGKDVDHPNGSRFGFELLWAAPDAGDTLAQATWAYQAP